MRTLEEMIRRYAQASGRRPVGPAWQHLLRQRNMARNENPPMLRGELFTFYSDGLGQTVDAAGAVDLEGKEWVFEDTDYSQYSVRSARSGKYVICRLVRNKSGGALLPGLAAKWKLDGTTANIFGGQVSGYATAEGDMGGIIDEFLPAAGVPADGLFWLVMEGPVKMQSAAAGDTSWGVGDIVVPSTGGKMVQASAPANEAAVVAQLKGITAASCEVVSAINTQFIGILKRNYG